MRKLPLFGPPSDVLVSTHDLCALSAALNAIVDELAFSVCTEEACGCASSVMVRMAREQRDWLDSFIDAIAARQPENLPHSDKK